MAPSRQPTKRDDRFAELKEPEAAPPFGKSVIRPPVSSRKVNADTQTGEVATRLQFWRRENGVRGLRRAEIGQMDPRARNSTRFAPERLPQPGAVTFGRKISLERAGRFRLKSAPSFLRPRIVSRLGPSLRLGKAPPSPSACRGGGNTTAACKNRNRRGGCLENAIDRPAAKPAKRVGNSRLAVRKAIYGIWSGRRDLNPRPQPWQGCALPLSYVRFLAPFNP